jgi:thiamine pyrophosphokinase
MPDGLPFTAYIFLNGDLQRGPAVLHTLREAEHAPRRLIIAADGGIRHIYETALRPDVVIGDMDSAPPQLLARARHEGAEVIPYPAEKDETDFELALLLAAQRGATRIRVIAASGDRLDQTLANVLLLAHPALAHCDSRLVSGGQTTWLARPGAFEIHGKVGDTLSLIPLYHDAEGIFTEGLAYPLHGETLRFGPARGVSNALTAPTAHVRLTAGLLLVIHTHGKA